MPNPAARTTVEIGEDSFNALSIQFGVTTLHDGVGMPVMGVTATSITLTADMYDEGDLNFATLQTLFTLANNVTRSKIVDIRITCWKDAKRDDAICAFSFRGWISSYFVIGNPDANHLLNLTLQPELDQMHYLKINMSN